MTPQESSMIEDLIRKVEGTPLSEKDPEAEQLLLQGLGRDPDAIYKLAQTVLIQNLALNQARAQIQQLQEAAQAQPQQPARATSFLGGLLGHRDPAPVAPPPPQAQYQPVPYQQRPIHFGNHDAWTRWLVDDQRFVDGRPDVLTYESEPLTEDLTVTGDPVAHLYAATTGSDADWVVKLIDVYPESMSDKSLRGFELMVAAEVFRARYRASFERPAPLVPGEVTAYAIGLRDRNHTFKAGHRIMVQVQSTLFPVIDLNPQRYVPSIYQAVESDFRSATQSLYRSPQFASYLSLPVNTHPPR